MSVSINDLRSEFQQLLDRAHHEASHRTAASKCYYFIYHSCKSMWPSVAASGTHGMHRAFYKGLQGAQGLEKIGSKLEKLHNLRVTADYHLDRSFFPAQLKRAQELAESIVVDIQNIGTKDEI
ncbi:MAG: HEPN domain-containing protein [Magnetococcales bacterium]|nr:HEPN domain-containing protein [Magnetococcales bacterium]MBF0116431.1 HEPN domain-containing protein [Magnetococcales bacterium]